MCGLFLFLGEVVLFGGKRDEGEDDKVIVLCEVYEEIGLEFFYVKIVIVFELFFFKVSIKF